MKRLPEPIAKRLRGGIFDSTDADGCNGVFIMRAPSTKRRLRILSSEPTDEIPWEHVSVSLVDAVSDCPSWSEMCDVKNAFWDASECVVQFHPPPPKASTSTCTQGVCTCGVPHS
jgi:hypothetical protein